MDTFYLRSTTAQGNWILWTIVCNASTYLRRKEAATPYVSGVEWPGKDHRPRHPRGTALAIQPSLRS